MTFIWRFIGNSPQTKQLLVSECHTLEKDGKVQDFDYDFSMPCWTREELESNLVAAGFGSIEYHGGYGPNVPMGSTDRIVAVACLDGRN